MATIIIRNSTGPGATPSSLVQGELAINTVDGKLFYGSGSGNVVKEFPTFPYTGSAAISGALNVIGTTTLTGSLSVSGSGKLTNGLQVTGSLIAPSITGSLQGTASYATQALSSSYALTASFALNGGGGSTFPYTGSAVITGSLIVTGSTTSTLGFTGSLQGTASYATTAANGGVTKILAGANINLSPVNGLGDVTVTSFGTNLYNTATGSYGSFYDTGSVLATSATAIYSMSLSTTDISNGVSISASGGDITRVKFTNAGTYNVQFSSQFSNSDNSIQDVVIWIKKNGVDVADSSGTVGVPPFKAGSNGQVIASWNYYLNLSANDFIQLCWHVEQANVIMLETIAAGTSPTHPRTPSTILTANRVDTFLSNTGSFSGSFNGSFTGSLFGTASWATNALTASFINTASTNAFVQNGNSFGATALLGTNDNQSLAFETSGSTRMFISSSGNVGIGTTSSTYNLEVVGSNTNTARFYGGSGTAVVGIGVNGTLQSSGGQFRLYGNSSVPLTLGSYGVWGDLWIINGNVSIGQGTTAPTLSSRFTIKGSGATSATTALRVENTNASASLVVLDNGNVGIGTTTPTASLHISASTSDAAYSFLVQNSSGQTLMSVQNNRTVSINAANGTNGGTTIGTTTGGITFNSGYNNTLIGNALTFYSGNNHSTIQGWSSPTSGIAVGYAQTNTNPNTGSVFTVKGAAETSGSGVLFVTGSSTTRLLTVASETNSSILVVSGSGTVGISNTGVVNTALAITANGAGGGNFILQGYDSSAVNRFLVTATGRLQMTGTTDTGTTGTDERVRLTNTFNPTSGTREHMGIYLVQAISQSGGANGITRGLYIQPTLTAATDYRAIETTSGSVLFQNGSVTSTSGFTGSLLGTASYATRALSASWAPSVASNPFPFTGSAIISGSLTITGSLLISGSISQLSVFRNFNTGSTVGPGGSAATASLSFAIPANTFKPRDVVRVKVRIAKTATGGNTTVTIFHNYTNTLLGANNLGIFTGNAAFMQLERTYNLLPQGGVSLSCELESAGVGTSLATDNTATNRLTTTTDFFLSSFLIIAISNTNATDTASVTMVTIERV